MIYPLNYGYLPGTIAEDGEEIDAYLVGEFKPLSEYTGVVIAVIHRLNDREDKLVVAKRPNQYSAEQVQALTEFQERFFDFEILTVE
nr:inorganic diphosphatase [Caproicibacter fermentans]